MKTKMRTHRIWCSLRFKSILKIFIILYICIPTVSQAESRILCRIIAAGKKVSEAFARPKANETPRVVANVEIRPLIKKMRGLEPVIPLLNSLSFEGPESKVSEDGQGITIYASNLINADKPISGGGRIRFQFDTHRKSIDLFFIFGKSPETLLRLWNIKRMALEQTYSQFPNKEDALEIHLRRKEALVPESYQNTSVGRFDTSSYSYPHNFNFSLSSRSEFDVQLLQNLSVNIAKLRDNQIPQNELTKDQAYYSLSSVEPGLIVDHQPVTSLFNSLSDGISTWLDLPDGKITQSEMNDLRQERKQNSPAVKASRAIRELLAQRKYRDSASKNNKVLQNFFEQGKLIALKAEDFKADSTENSEKFWHEYLTENPEALGFKTETSLVLYSLGGRARTFGPETLLLVHKNGAVQYFQTNNHPVPQVLSDNPMHEGI